jgi:nucleoside-diphosphate-sugar epimerase
MILVTGAAGLVGHPVANRLARAGNAVIATDARPPDKPLDCPFVEADLRDPTAISGLFENHDIRQVVHGGAISGSMVAPNEPLRVMSVNVTGTILMAEACRQAGIDRLVGLSSIGVYGDQPGTAPVREDSRRLGTDIYSCSKIAMEGVLLGYRENFGVPAFLLRMSSIFGQGRRTPCFIRGLLEAADEGREVTVSADTEHRRQFLYIDDAVEAVCLALTAPTLPEFVYNITGGTWLTEGEVIAAAKRAVPNLRAKTGDVAPLGLDGRMGPLDISLATRDLGYRPRTGLEEGIARYARSRATGAIGP